MFRIKICGVTRPEDGQAVGQAGADAVGLNFYPRSPRYINLDRAVEIVNSLPQGVSKVGVFVNHSVEHVIDIAETLQLDFIQLHGDENPDTIARLGHRRVIRALRCSVDRFDAAQQYLNECERLGGMPAAVLIDANIPGQFGGTGQTADWRSIGQWWSTWGPLPLILAGGLRPDNVAQAIRIVRPKAVDTAGGVESSPGVKDPILLGEYVNAAKAGFAAT